MYSDATNNNTPYDECRDEESTYKNNIMVDVDDGYMIIIKK
jgi:hypothetical protein